VNVEEGADTLTDGEMHRSAVRPNDRVGRYTLLERVGFGGMGVVFLALDPELERHVAIKVLHRDPRREDVASRRLLREARTMARLVHPNVVAVHDVGTHQGHVFVAMEFVRGGDLRRWIRHEHPWREVAQAMLQAGRGLVAAHAAGVVHRDFKPDNVMVDRSGRVCVTDFGMAAAVRDEEPPSHDEASPTAIAGSEMLTRTNGIGGTPAYLAPEQFEGKPGDAASDQFAYCVTFFEALWGERPFAGSAAAELAIHVVAGDVVTPPSGRGVPMWLRRLVLRGLSADPALRWPSMLALTEALEQRLSGRRARAVYVLTGVAMTGAVGATMWLAMREPTASCDADAALAEVWNDRARARVGAAIDVASRSGADDLVARFDARVSAWTAAWTTVYRNVCDLDGQWPPALAQRAARCLDRRLGDLDAAIEVLASVGGLRGAGALDIAEGLPRPEPCADEQVLAAEVEPPADAESIGRATDLRASLAELTARRIAGSFDALEGETVELVARARTAEYPPVLAEALLEQGRVLSSLGRAEAAEAAFDESFYVATAAQHRTVALAAATELVMEVGHALARLDDGMEWSRHASALLTTLPPDPEASAKLDWAVADLHTDRNQLDLARTLLERGLATYEAAGLAQRAAAMHASLGFIALRAGDLDEGARRLGLARDLAAARLGPHHPDTAQPLIGLATIEQRRGNLDAAAELMQQARAIYEDVFGPEHVNVAGCMHNLASIELARGNAVAARDLLEPTLALRERLLGVNHPDIAGTLGLLGVVYEELGDFRRARDANERGLAIAIATYGPRHPRVADILHNLGTLAATQHDTARAIDVYERALAIRIESQGADHPDVAMLYGNLGRAQLEAGEIAKAKQSALRAVAISEAQLGADHERTRDERELLADVEAAQR